MLKGSSKKKKIALVSIIMVSVILIILLYLTTIPTHKFNNFHTDSVGDVEDENIDIVSIRSYEKGDNIILEMKVAGQIISNHSMYFYHLSVVCRNIEDENSNEEEEGCVFRCIYSNGSVITYDIKSEVNNNTLKIYFPKNLLGEEFYMTGLEGFTDGIHEQDSCREGQERGNEIQYGLLASLFSIIICVGIVSTEVGKYKLFSFFFPLYSRLKNEDVLDQFVRGQIYGLVRAQPGIHYSKIKRILKVGNGTLAYHLSVLEKERFIKVQHASLRKLFYPTELPAKFNELENKFPKGEDVTKGIKLSELHEQIVTLIKKQPGIMQTQIATQLDVPKQTISYNIKSLAKSNIIKVVREGNKTRCYMKSESSE